MIRDDATQRQVDAARPTASTWLSANAGSGKTRVLTDRVARLLLGDVPPDHILCLTYTKAAATEMQNRLFRRLGAWAMLDDAALRAELANLGEDPGPDPRALEEARTLFARAIETPGGLRIQTIHSFCASLLRRFPLEAGVSPNFKEVEDRAAELLRQDIVDDMARGDEAPLVADISLYHSDLTLDDVTAAIVSNADGFETGFDRGHDLAALRRLYGAPENASLDSLVGDVFAGGGLAFVQQIAPVYAASDKSTDQKMGAALAAVHTEDEAGLRALQAAFLTKGDTRKKALATKGLSEGAMAPHMMRLEILAGLVEDSRQVEKALRAAERDAALYRFAAAFLPRYEQEKQRRGWLDFDDLINRASGLLADPKVSEWVLYRLDGGIDHILVDEAQDTSPRQWQVIERLAQEIVAGEGARSDVVRTIFVVGDKKQSIYSFQGADAAEFDRMRAEFAQRLEASPRPLVPMSLEYSFRSAAPILELVDHTFEDRRESGFPKEDRHRAFKAQMPGRVDLWPLVEKTVDPDTDRDWYDPVDYISPRHHKVVIAQRVARTIRALIDGGQGLPAADGTLRPVHAGDFLILVRSRTSGPFAEIIRACKQEGLPIAGADRLKVMAELAVRDVAAVLAFLDNTSDDLSLATALRSPLFGLSEQDLFDLAHRRGGQFLWRSLYDRKAAFPQTVAVLEDLMAQTDFLRPFDLIERLLVRHNGRPLLLGRLGEEAEDGLNALLAQALAYEQAEIPSLTGFLQWMQTDSLEIKRQSDSAGGRIRVMTVHGAKGLEAPIVILPDCTVPRRDVKDLLIRDAAGVMWKTPSAERPPRQAEVIAGLQEAQARERDRLLYVAMTRAENWLMVGAYDDLGKGSDAWYTQVRSGLERVGARAQRFDFGPHGAGEGLRFEAGDWSGPVSTAPRIEEAEAQSLPGWATCLPPDPAPMPKQISPSDLGGAKALPGEQGEAPEIAMAQGSAMHFVLEHLPKVDKAARADLGRKLLKRAFPDLGDAISEDVLSRALSVLSAPAAAPIFGPGALAEVPVQGALPGLGAVYGIVDRLIVTDAVVTAVDFKTNRHVPRRPDQVPEGLLRQMGAYGAVLAQIWPEHRIELAILWTETAEVMRLPHDLVTQALARADLDVGGLST